MVARPVSTVAEWLQQAATAERRGDAPGALAVMTKALAEHSRDPALANSGANFAMRAGDYGQAAEWFSAAARLDPTSLEFALNHAIALSRMDRYSQALAALAPFEPAGAANARYCSARGIAERGAGNPGDAQRWFDRCLALDPRQPRALHGRARLALERGEADALERFDRALAINPGDADLWLGKAQALDVEGRVEEARQLAQQIVQQAPGWEHGTRFLAQLRLAAGEDDFTSHYREAAAKQPQNPNIRADWAELLGSLDRFAEAAEVLAHARRDFPDIERFALLEAIAAGAAGDDAQAEELFAGLQTDSVERHVHESRHRLRRGEPERAESLLARAIEIDDSDIAAWALRDVAWRLLGDERHEWLHGRDGLVQFLPLEQAEDEIASSVALLDSLHDTSAFPLSQSLRGGTQTRGLLFARLEPELVSLKAAITDRLEVYRAGLPPADAAHPLLRHRDAPWRIGGSWSVRLDGGGDHHTAHLHPQGILSSALYLALPQERAAGEGALELGRPAADLRLDLPPVRVIEPRAGHLALFPSTLYHGTTAFPRGRRMTVAFDVLTLDEAKP